MGNYSDQKWVELYRAALAEKRKNLIVARVTAARIEMADRLTKLDGHPSSSEERQAIDGAVIALKLVERQSQGPDQ
jgi:hypothetical protein